MRLARPSLRWLAVAALALLACVGADFALAQTPIADIQRAEPVDFEKEILPVLKRNCIACHNAAKPEKGLSLETPQSIAKGGDSGAAVTPRDSASSLLLLVASHQSDPFMPPKDNKVNAQSFTSEELGLLKLWIDQGAEGMVTGGSGPLNWQPLPPGVNPIFAVALSGDGQFAACGRANQVFIYHVPSGQVVCRLTDPALLTGGVYDQLGVAHLDLVQSLAFNPAGDLLASGGYREVKIWRRPVNVRTHNLAASAQGAVGAVAVSTDGRWLATGAEDNSVHLFDLEAGAAGPTITGHTGAVTSLRFTADGARLVSSSLDRTVRVWNVADGAPLGRLDTPVPVNGMTLVGDETRVATGGDDKYIRLWSLPVGPARSLADLPTPLTALAISADRRLLAVGGGDGQAALVDLAAGTIVRKWAAHEGGVTAVSFSAGNARLVTGGADRATRVWNVGDDQLVAAVYGGAVPVAEVAISPNGNQAASAWGEGQVGVWKLDVPAPRPLPGEVAVAPTVSAASANGQLLAVDGQAEGKPAILVRDAASGNVVKTLLGHEGAILSLAFSPDGSRLVSGAADNTARVWNLADGAELAKFVGHAAAVTGVAFNSNGQQVASGAADNSLKLWNVADLAVLKDLPGHTGAIVGVAMATNDQFILSASADQSVRVWNPADGSTIRTIAPGAAATALALSRDNNRLAVAGADNAVRVYQIDGTLAFTLAGHTSPAKSLSFSGDGLRLVSGGGDNQVLAWELTGGALAEVLPVSAGVAFAQFGADAITVLIGAADKSIVATSLHFERALTGNPMRITALVYSNDGGAIYTSGLDGTVRAYGAGDGGQRYSVGSGVAINDLALSPNGQYLAAAAEDKTIRLHNAGDGQMPKPPYAGFEQPVRSVSFSADGVKLAGGTAGNEVLVFDINANQQDALEQGFREHAGPVEALAAAGDQTAPVWISASAGEGVRIWPHRLIRVSTGHGGPVTSLDTIAATPTQIISGSQDGTLRRWNTDNGQEMGQLGHGAPILAVAARPDGKRFASVGDKFCRLWNAENNQMVADLKGDIRLQSALALATRELQKAQTLVATRMQTLAADEQRVPQAAEAVTRTTEALNQATTAFNEKATVAQTAKDAKAAADKALTDQAAVVQTAQAAFDAAKQAADADANNADLAAARTTAEQTLAAANATLEQLKAAAAQAQQVFDAANNELKTAEETKKNAEAAKADADKETTRVATAVETGKQKLAEAQQSVTTREAAVQTATAASTAGELPLRTVAFSPDNIRIAVAGDDLALHTFDSNTGQAYDIYLGHTGVVRALAFVDEGALATGSADQSAGVWELSPEWTLERTIGGVDQPTLADRVIALDFNPDGTLLAVGGGEPSRSGELKIFNVADGALVRDLPDAHSDTVFGVDFSADGLYLASCAADKFVKVFEVGTGNRVRSFEGHTHHVLGVSWKTDGTRLVSAGADNALKVWSFETGDQLATMQGFAKQVTSVAFIGDSPNVISSGGDATVRMFNTDNAQNYRNFGGPTDFVYAAASTPDGKLVVAGGQDSILRVWNGESSQLLFALDPAGPNVAAAANSDPAPVRRRRRRRRGQDQVLQTVVQQAERAAAAASEE
jgi:WD40 repeat protein